MKERRQPGTGTVEQLPSGTWRARIWLSDGERHDFGPYDTEQEATDTIDAIAFEVAEGPGLATGITWRGWLAKWKDALELSRTYVGMANVRSISKNRLELAPFADWPIRRVTEFAVKRWVDDLAKVKTLSRSSKEQTLSLARKAFAAAVEAKVLDQNPAAKVKLPRSAVPTEEPWTYLTLEEQRALLASSALPRPWLLMVTFAIGTGLRAGEQWCLRLADLHVDGADPHVVVRYGSRKRAPKGRRMRTVPLFGDALEAAREWLDQLADWCPRNDFALAFPGQRGGFQKVSRLPAEWKAWLKSGGVTRRVRWHDLRHTCGSSLVSGWWGRAWSLQEVRDLLGHKSIDETERYAHLGETALKAAARGTGGGGFGGGGPRTVQTAPQPRGSAVNVQLPRHSPRKRTQASENIGETASSVDRAWTRVCALAEELVRQAAAGEDCAAAKHAFGSALIALGLEALADGPHGLMRAIEIAGAIPPEASAPGVRTRGAAS